MKKTIGIIGGMGPDASCDLYNRINKLTPASKDQDHIHLIIDSYPQIADRTANIVGNGENPVPYLVRSAKLLENAGADAVMMACNTAHFFAEEVEAALNIKFISIVDAVLKALQEKNVNKVAILCTGGTSKARIYDKKLNEAGIETLYAEQKDQELLMTLIYGYVKSGKSLKDNPIKNDVVALKNKMQAQGAEAFVLACTELPIAFAQLGLIDDKTIDSTQELAKAAIEFASK